MYRKITKLVVTLENGQTQTFEGHGHVTVHESRIQAGTMPNDKKDDLVSFASATVRTA